MDQIKAQETASVNETVARGTPVVVLDQPQPQSSLKPASLRWKILRSALLRRPTNFDNSSEKINLHNVSRRARSGFNLIRCHVVNDGTEDPESLHRRDVCFYYTLSLPNAPKLCLRQRWEDCVDLNDFEVCNRYDIDNTGLICQWPSEDVLAYYSMSRPDYFRNKRVIELGSGYGLAGFIIATVTEAIEVVISDGNPQVVDYIQCNIDANSAAVGSTKVKSMVLHWDQEVSDMSGTFDIIVASDCTFFKKFHKGLARTIRCLLKEDGPSEAILFSPKRGDSLDKFLVEVEATGLHFTMIQTYDTEIWSRHKSFINGDQSWPNYEEDHCYPLLISITR